MFEWDPIKASLNLKKHGVSFEEASSIFDDRRGLDWVDLDHSQDEKRSKRMGQSDTGRILLVVYTERKNHHGKKTKRIISARQASRKERQAYFG